MIECYNAISSQDTGTIWKLRPVSNSFLATWLREMIFKSHRFDFGLDIAQNDGSCDFPLSNHGAMLKFYLLPGYWSYESFENSFWKHLSSLTRWDSLQRSPIRFWSFLSTFSGSLTPNLISTRWDQKPEFHVRFPKIETKILKSVSKAKNSQNLNT